MSSWASSTAIPRQNDLQEDLRMAMDKKFENIVVEQKKQKKRIDELTILKESDKNTIFNLIFSEKTPEKNESNT